MAGQNGTILRVAALCILATITAACAPVEAPHLGSGPPVLSPKTLTTLTTPASTNKVVTFALGPITNAPGEMIYAFEDALKQKASARQLAIVAADDPTADYKIKAYLSAVGDSSGGLVIYVLDIFDRSGTRVHRVSGQINSGGSVADPWATVHGTDVAGDAAQGAIDALGNWAHS